MTQHDETSQSTSNSPTKKGGKDSSPTKSRNKRRNDAKRRSGNFKKQTINTEQSENQHSEAKSTSPQPQQPPPAISTRPLESNRAEQVNQETNMPDDLKPDDKPFTPSPKPQKPPSTAQINEDIKSNKDKNKQVDNHTVKDNIKLTRECRDLKEQLKLQNFQIQGFVEQYKQQLNKTKELEEALLKTNRTCNQLEKLLEQEILSRNNLEAENTILGQTVLRLKKQLTAHEKNNFANDELVRVLNATLMERETEMSILKLKLTRIQTNPSSVVALNSASSVTSVRQEPSQVYASTGRSNSEFDRNSYIRSSIIAEVASARASTSQLKTIDRDALVWATVPEELTPSKRPLILQDRDFQSTYNESHYYSPYGNIQQDMGNNSLTKPIERDRRYKTLPRSMKSPSQEFKDHVVEQKQSTHTAYVESSLKQESYCQITNLDDSNSTNQSSGCNRTLNSSVNNDPKQQQLTTSNESGLPKIVINSHTNVIGTAQQVNTNCQDNQGTAQNRNSLGALDESHYSSISKTNIHAIDDRRLIATFDIKNTQDLPSLPTRIPTTPIKLTHKMKKIFDKFRKSDSSANSTNNGESASSTSNTPTTSPFQRGATRSTMVASPNNIRSQMSPTRNIVQFHTDKPFAEWDTEMLVDWLTMIGLSMYTSQCRRWVKCGAHIMNATPAEVDKGLGITNHLHRKKLRLAISELNGDSDKITKAASKLDYLWVARWLDDIGLPQYKEAFINARVDGRVLNYLTVDDLVSMGVKSLLHHASIRCGIKVLRSIKFDLQLLKRRATADEIEEMNSMRRHLNQVADDPNGLSFTHEATNMKGDNELALWTCHRLMEWLRLIDFAEFAPNLRGSGVHGGLIVFEDGFNIDTMCALLSIPTGRTLLRRHLSTFFQELVGGELTEKKQQYQYIASNQQLNPTAEIKTPKKSQLWFTKMKSSKVNQEGTDEYLCPMYPVEPQIFKKIERKKESDFKEPQLSNIPESINV